jgi:hypothetical protein
MRHLSVEVRHQNNVALIHFGQILALPNRSILVEENQFLIEIGHYLLALRDHFGKSDTLEVSNYFYHVVIPENGDAGLILVGHLAGLNGLSGLKGQFFAS